MSDANHDEKPHLKPFITKINRRQFLQGTAVAATGILLPNEASAAATQYKVKRMKLPVRPREKRYSPVRDIGSTGLLVDEKLSDRKIRPLAPIESVRFSTRTKDFAGLTPEDPRDRLDYAILKFFANIDLIQADIKDPGLPKGPFHSDQISGALFDRAFAAELPPRYDGMAQNFADRLAQGEVKSLSLWSYTKVEASPNSFQLMEFDPRKGVDVRFLATAPIVTLSASGGSTSTGYSHYIANKKLTLAVYNADADFAWGEPDGIQPDRMMDLSYSLDLYSVIEYLSLFGGRWDLQSVFDDRYFPIRKATVGYCLFSDIAELTAGKLEQGFFMSAPVLHVDRINSCQQSRRSLRSSPQSLVPKTGCIFAAESL